SPGTGKTSSVYALARECGYEVVEFNMSDYRTEEYVGRVKTHMLSKLLEPTIILLDEVDGCSRLEEILTEMRRSVNPIIMTANSYSIVDSVRKYDYVKILNFRKPKLSAVAKFTKMRVKELGLRNVDYSGLREDWRSVQHVLVGGKGTDTESRNEILLKLVREGAENIGKLNAPEVYNLVATLVTHSFGYNLWLSLKLLQYYVLLREPEVLQGMRNPNITSITFSTLLQKAKAKGIFQGFFVVNH
ncbi:MAG: AAA family ATPase, partial [Candidatus Jordarchaeales archaeon]